MNQSNLQPILLRCEYRENPSVLDERVPRLSWALEGEGRGRRQSAYQILVATSTDLLDTTQPDAWDSGKVYGADTLNIEYAGIPLHSGERYFWRVQVWDENDAESELSETATWAMGLLDPSDWRALWIEPEVPQSPSRLSGVEFDEVLDSITPPSYLRNKFDITKKVGRATVYATARGVYELYLNGARVGDDVLAPGWTDYNKRVQYQAHDVTSLLTQGTNALGGVLGDGWYSGYIGFQGKRANYGEHPQLLVQLQIEYDDGSTETVVTDGSWKWSAGPIVYSDMLMGEYYDARRELTGWLEQGFDDSAWSSVKATERSDVPLVAQPDDPIKVVMEVRPVGISEPQPGTYIFDMGQNMVGWVRLRVRGEAGTVVQLRFVEMLNPDSTPYTENLRSARQTDTYILKGGEETREPRFTFHGFRYVEVTGLPGEPTLDMLTGRVIQSATPEAGTFECSSPMVNQLQRNIVWGQRGNFISVPTDCPQRDERLGWLGDAQVFVRTATCNMDVSAFFTKWMRDVEDAQSAEGAFPDVAPRLVDEADGAPAWGDAGIIVPWTMYQVYSDSRLLERHYDAMSRWVDYIREANPNLIWKERLNNNFGDWLSIDADTPKEVLATAYFAYDASLMSRIARALDRESDAAEYERLYEGIKSAFQREFIGPDGRIAGDTQTCYVLALKMNLLPEDQRERGARYLVENIREKEWHLSTGFLGVGYLCPVLTDTDHLDVAYRLLNNDTFPSWGYSIRHGATTIWERWDGWTEEKGFQDPAMNSFNHYSLGSVGEWLYRYVAGIDTDTANPGFGRVLIAPHPGGGLEYARAEYNSVRGRIESDWRFEGEHLVLRCVVPPNTTATVRVPASDPSTVTESNEPTMDAKGVRVVGAEPDAAVFEVGSGEYLFRSVYGG